MNAPPILALGLFLCAGPASAEADQNCVKDAQRRRLEAYRLSGSPDLSAAGLRLAGGVYRWDADRRPAAASDCPTPAELDEAIEKVLRSEAAEGLRKERLERPRGVPPGARSLRTLGRTLEAADGPDAALTLGAYFDRQGAQGGSPPVGYRAAAHAPLPPAGSSARAKREGAPPPVASALTAGAARSGLSPSALKEAVDSGALRGRPPAEIARLKAGLIPLTAFRDDKTRQKALHLLGLLHDESLAPVFLARVGRDESAGVRAEAVRALGSILGGYKSAASGSDWGAYARKAPALLGALAVGAGDEDEARALLMDHLGNLNLMGQAHKAAFAAGLKDPEAALRLIAASSSRDDADEARGLHSSEAERLFARFKEFGRPLSAFLDLSDQAGRLAAGRLVTRLQRYDLLAPELKRDPGLAPALTRLAFHREPGAALEPERAYSIADLLWQSSGESFARDLLARARAGADRQFHRSAALLYLRLQERRLPERLKSEVDELAAASLPPAVKAELRERDRVPVYEHWPKGPLRAALLSTQANHIYEFVRDLERRGYRRTAKSREPDATEKIEIDGGRLSLHIEILPSNAKGWALDRAAVGRRMERLYADRRNHIVIYRGHLLEHDPLSLAQVRTRRKVFIDLSCDSAFASRRVVDNCEDCAYFGTTMTGIGAINSPFLATVLGALADRAGYREIERRVAARLPKTAYRFTGTWSGADLWTKALPRLEP